MSDCFTTDCPFRVNRTSNTNRCECVAYPNRTTNDFCIASDHTMTTKEVRRMSEWISVKDRLPEKRKTSFERYIVCVMRSHYPTSSYDFCDSPYSEELVITALYDSEQKLWHLDCDEVLNAMMDIADSPLNGDFVTHWMPLPSTEGIDHDT